MDDDRKRIKCPFCAELILEEALKCRFCHTDLSGGNQAQSVSGEIGLARALFYNASIPGLGAWKLGHQMRGAVILGLFIFCMATYVHQIRPVITRKLETAMRTGKTKQLETIGDDLKSNPWLGLGLLIYALSFADVWYLKNLEKTRKKKPE